MLDHVGYNDSAFLAAVLFFCTDIWCGWDAFRSCSAPIHGWLLVSLVCAILFRFAYLLTGPTIEMGNFGRLSAESGCKSSMVRAIELFVWCAAAPFFLLWNLTGTLWLWKVLQESPQCVPSDTYIWFSGLWLFLCYYWLFIHAALAVKAVFRRPQALSEDADVDSRGLSARDLQILPSEVWHQAVTCECPVCMEDFQEGDAVRRLPGCNHVFHRDCIDLWLSRSADCPMCKQNVSRSLGWL